MNVEIITVGTELLLGDTLDTNSQYLSKKMKQLGFNLYRKVTVGDNAKRLMEELEYALEHFDLVITTGGTGPTIDDITKEVCAQVLNQVSILRDESAIRLKRYFKDNEKAYEGNIKQAMFPENAVIFPNDQGTADGCMLQKNQKKIILLPGPPSELQPMFDHYVYPVLEQYATEVIYSETLKLSLIGEWEMSQRVEDLLKNSSNPSIAPYFKRDGCLLKITAKAENQEKCKQMIAPIKYTLYEKFGNLIYAENDQTKEEIVYQLLKKHQLTIMTAESITGGMLASTLINVAGMSDYLKQSLVVYSDEAKEMLLHVPKEIIEKFGAVSEPCCRSMVEQMQKSYHPDVALATTGYAGPGKNAGLVYIGIGIKNDVRVIELQVSGDRNKVRERTVKRILEETRLLILEYFE